MINPQLTARADRTWRLPRSVRETLMDSTTATAELGWTVYPTSGVSDSTSCSSADSKAQQPRSGWRNRGQLFLRGLRLSLVLAGQETCTTGSEVNKGLPSAGMATSAAACAPG
ncbi:hypothetical protein COCON_G00181440 [Conger conger]|uniref:Uncharacterized protein n=1 Tax=Conger conger TaxID=82655 RepID=A0A9Q1D6H2_CONCO|nr:hypothetical protein COCON_G00181440 [Conger conger]